MLKFYRIENEDGTHTYKTNCVKCGGRGRQCCLPLCPNLPFEVVDAIWQSAAEDAAKKTEEKISEALREEIWLTGYARGRHHE